MQREIIQLQITQQFHIEPGQPPKQVFIDMKVLSSQADLRSKAMALLCALGIDELCTEHHTTGYTGWKLRSASGRNPYVLILYTRGGHLHVSMTKRLLQKHILFLVSKVVPYGDANEPHGGLNVENPEGYHRTGINLWVGEHHELALGQLLQEQGFQNLLAKLEGDFRGRHCLALFRKQCVEGYLDETEVDEDIDFLRQRGVGLELEVDGFFPHMMTTTIESEDDLNAYLPFVIARIKEGH